MRLLRKIFGGISLTAAMFVFQACYGSMDAENYRDITIRVTDADNGQPMQDVKVESQRVCTSRHNQVTSDWRLLGYTDSLGIADSYIYLTDGYADKLRFTAQDSSYIVLDTIAVGGPGYNRYSISDTFEVVLHRLD